MTPNAIWSRAALIIRLQPPPGSNVARWSPSLTLDDARSFVRELSLAIETGQKHLNELTEQGKS